MKLCFISDLHLTGQRHETIDLFYRFLNEHGRSCQGLYLLGDFFEVWLGSDAASLAELAVLDALKKLVDDGVPVYYLVGNRDFLIEEAFLSTYGIIPLQEPYVLSLPSHKLLLMHGDALCTQDRSYQLFRRVVRQSWIKKLFLSFPLRWRSKIAQKLRMSSKTKYDRSSDRRYLDVAPQTVVTICNQYQCDYLIHGHTHLAKIEAIDAHKVCQRIVLGEWSKTEGSMLLIQDGQLELRCYPHETD